MADIATLLFLLQQLGLTLGVGAATFSLMFFVLGLRDGAIDSKEERFIHATNTVLAFSLFLIVLTGALVTAAHVLADELAIVMAPVFLAKWALILIITVNGVVRRFNFYPPMLGSIVSGASWYALFIVHTLVPDVSWAVLGIGYALWIAVFALGFSIVQKGTREEQPLPARSPQIVAPRPAPQSAPQPRLVPTLAAVPSVVSQPPPPPPQLRPVPVSKFVPAPQESVPRPTPPIEFDLRKVSAAATHPVSTVPTIPTPPVQEK